MKRSCCLAAFRSEPVVIPVAFSCGVLLGARMLSIFGGLDEVC